MDQTKALETQKTWNKIKELTDEINNTQQHQRNYSLKSYLGRNPEHAKIY